MRALTTWILVGDASRARLFSTNGKGKPWQLVKEFEHPESRLKGLDIMADRPGRMQQSTTGAKPGMEPGTPPKEVEAIRFAQSLAGEIQTAHGRNAFESLVLVAPPDFLGLLRQSLSNPVHKRIRHTVAKDLTQVPERELPERLADTL
jgi:protein required for attachment to host cells